MSNRGRAGNLDFSIFSRFLSTFWMIFAPKTAPKSTPSPIKIASKSKSRLATSWNRLGRVLDASSSEKPPQHKPVVAKNGKRGNVNKEYLVVCSIFISSMLLCFCCYVFLKVSLVGRSARFARCARSLAALALRVSIFLQFFS